MHEEINTSPRNQHKKIEIQKLITINIAASKLQTIHIHILVVGRHTKQCCHYHGSNFCTSENPLTAIPRSL